jgi:hypothetical protein
MNNIRTKLRSDFIDMTGLKFGKLTCIKYAGKDRQGLSLWLCKCDCGKETTTRGSGLRGGTTRSCGCAWKEMMAKINTTHSLSVDKNGNTPRLYRAWRNMKSRCFNPNTPKYKNHGGRGITVCEQWMDYLNFHKWAMSNGYNDNLTLERKDNNGNYEPSNCTWASYGQQNINRRNTHLVTYRGETRPLIEWADILGLKQSTLRCRLDDYNWDVEKAFSEPTGKHRHRAAIEYRGKTQSLREWSKELGIPYKALHARLFSRGWDIDKAFNQTLRRINHDGN